MPSARYVSLRDSDGGVELPSEIINDIHYADFDAPGLDSNSENRPILFFKVDVREPNTRLFIILNDTPLVQKELNPAGLNSFHESFPGRALLETGNQLTAAVSVGKIFISDVFILYTTT